MGLEANYPDNAVVWEAFENIFTALFLAETALKVFVMGASYMHDTWNLMDGALAALAVVGVWVLPGLNSVGMRLDLRSLSLLRIFRIARLARILRLVKRLE